MRKLTFCTFWGHQYSYVMTDKRSWYFCFILIQVLLSCVLISLLQRNKKIKTMSTACCISITHPTDCEPLLKSRFMWSSSGQGWTMAFQLNGLFHSQNPVERSAYIHPGRSDCCLEMWPVQNWSQWCSLNRSISASGAFFENHCGTSQPPSIDTMHCQTLLAWSVYSEGRVYRRIANSADEWCFQSGL